MAAKRWSQSDEPKAMSFVNRETELARLEEWWRQSDSNLGLVWGRRRVGKTALLQRFSRDKRVVITQAAAAPRQMSFAL